MKCLAVCQDELLIRTLHQVLAPKFELEFLVENKPLARRLHEAGLPISVADPRRCDSYLKCDLSPNNCVLIQDTGRRSLSKIVDAARDAGGTLIYVIGTGTASGDESKERESEIKNEFPEVTYLTLGELLKSPLMVELRRSLTRARVQQYQRYFTDADRVLIMLHNDPDPDAMASGLALRTLLRRTKTTAILGALQPMTRPENLRMAHLLDIHVETVTPAQFSEFDRIATVDVQPPYFGGALERADLVIDHHPEQPNTNAIFKDVRPYYGSTCTILTEHLRAVDFDISERIATAMLYAIKSDTLFFARQTNHVDLEAFSFLYPLADAALIRKMEGAELTLDRLQFVTRAVRDGRMADQVFSAFLGTVPREDYITYAADFFLDLEDVKWTILSGVVNEMLIISVRNLGYTRNAGEFVKRWFSEIGSAGGHRSMAKAVVPIHRFAEKFGTPDAQHMDRIIRGLVDQFLHDANGTDKKKDQKEPVPVPVRST
jgi:nanoRNase/pAp phosphatase (c-di-AMP/oligoRNAs hydrolase)